MDVNQFKSLRATFVAYVLIQFFLNGAYFQAPRIVAVAVRKASDVTVCGAHSGATVIAIRENSPRRNGRVIAGPSLRLKNEPHSPDSAIGTTGTGVRSMMREIPPRNG